MSKSQRRAGQTALKLRKCTAPADDPHSFPAPTVRRFMSTCNSREGDQTPFCEHLHTHDIAGCAHNHIQHTDIYIFTYINTCEREKGGQCLPCLVTTGVLSQNPGHRNPRTRTSPSDGPQNYQVISITRQEQQRPTEDSDG